MQQYAAVAGRFRLRGGAQIALENRKSMKFAIKRGERDSLPHSFRLNGFFYGSLLTGADGIYCMYPPYTTATHTRTLEARSSRVRLDCC